MWISDTSAKELYEVCKKFGLENEPINDDDGDGFVIYLGGIDSDVKYDFVYGYDGKVRLREYVDAPYDDNIIEDEEEIKSIVNSILLWR